MCVQQVCCLNNKDLYLTFAAGDGAYKGMPCLVCLMSTLITMINKSETTDGPRNDLKYNNGDSTEQGINRIDQRHN